MASLDTYIEDCAAKLRDLLPEVGSLAQELAPKSGVVIWDVFGGSVNRLTGPVPRHQTPVVSPLSVSTPPFRSSDLPSGTSAH